MKSILDTDLYKLTMQQCVCQLFPNEIVRYKLFVRNKVKWPENFVEELKSKILETRNIRLSPSEKIFLIFQCKFLTPVYIDFLQGYTFDPTEVSVRMDKDSGDLILDIIGPWYRTILWEVPLMSMISELYFKNEEPSFSRDERRSINRGKADIIKRNSLKVADFGTRRRFSLENQMEVIEDMGDSIFGTSNPLLAMTYNKKCVGTHAHEWFMFMAAKFGYQCANRMALEKWVEIYQGNLGIALTDTYTTDVFFDSFDLKFAKLFDGVRHDSGSPYLFAEKTITHYADMGIDPRSKTIIFSDGLDVDLATSIKNYCGGRIKTSFGIGTSLTNDVGLTPLNMVIKMTGVRRLNGSWKETVKLSDDTGKHTGSKEEIDLCIRSLET